jgi:hypothetical protein
MQIGNGPGVPKFVAAGSPAMSDGEEVKDRFFITLRSSPK